jgi:hypothetical protein
LQDQIVKISGARLPIVTQPTSGAVHVFVGQSEHTERLKVPPATDEAGRKAWLRERWVRRQGGEANRFRDSLIKWYGPENGAAVKFAEAFEICEYGHQPKPEEIKVLFPFFP